MNPFEIQEELNPIYERSFIQGVKLTIILISNGYDPDKLSQMTYNELWLEADILTEKLKNKLGEFNEDN